MYINKYLNILLAIYITCIDFTGIVFAQFYFAQRDWIS